MNIGCVPFEKANERQSASVKAITVVIGPEGFGFTATKAHVMDDAWPGVSTTSI